MEKENKLGRLLLPISSQYTHAIDIWETDEGIEIIARIEDSDGLARKQVTKKFSLWQLWMMTGLQPSLD